MKLNKSKNKGKVHPSPLTTTTTTTTNNNNSVIDPVSTLNNLLPQTILTLISILSLQDKQVLTYMITLHGKKSSSNTSSNSTPHKVPCFECACFDCYTSYWLKWDNSPHRELIHLAIEAFEEHLSLSEQASKKSNRTGNRKNSKLVLAAKPGCSSTKGGDDVEGEKGVVVVAAEEEQEEILKNADKRGKEEVHFEQGHNKGLVRKVLPDVIGLFNSRLFNLWGPNV